MVAHMDEEPRISRPSPLSIQRGHLFNDLGRSIEIVKSNHATVV